MFARPQYLDAVAAQDKNRRATLFHPPRVNLGHLCPLLRRRTVDLGSLTTADLPRTVPRRRFPVKDIHDVLRRKKAQLEVLGKQIAQLQEAAEELRSIAHLLQDEDHDSHPGR